MLWSRCVRHLNRFDGDGGTVEQWQTLCPPHDESMESRIHREVYGRFGGEHPEIGPRKGMRRWMLSLQTHSSCAHRSHVAA